MINALLKVKKLRDGALPPTVANPGQDLGYDLYAAEDITLHRGLTAKVPTGIAAYFEIDEVKDIEWGLLIRDRSSMASKGIITSGGVVDAGYRGEILVLMTLLGAPTYEIKKGDKIAQMIPLPVVTSAPVMQVDDLSVSTRGANGFGSTGR